MSLALAISAEAEALVEPSVCAQDYAIKLLADLGCPDVTLPDALIEHPALRWAHSGLMNLTGNSTPVMCPAPIASCADGALLAFRALAPDAALLSGLQGAHLFTERAALNGHTRAGRCAPGGSCRLVDAADGRIAVNLAREDDWAMMPAWLESDELTGAVDDWLAVETVISKLPVAALVERARLMGLAVSPDQPPQHPVNWTKTLARGMSALPDKQPLVVDLSTLWAGPLCSHLLQKAGARVIKVESPDRPDGARAGNSGFYDLLNEGKDSVCIDLKTEQGINQLKALLHKADVVIESARPRGLRQMGIVAEDIMQSRPGQTWVSITGYGREDEMADWVGFGDDAAVAAGLSHLMAEVTGEAMFVGDAIADPLTGIHAALAAWHSHINGGGRLIALALADVTAHCAGFGLPATSDALRQRFDDWSSRVDERDIKAPQVRKASVAARALGADTDRILSEFGIH